MSEKLISRRDLLRGAAAAAAFSIVPRHVLGGAGYTAPSEKVTRAIIGTGGMGMGHINYEGAVLLALCDADRNHLNRARDRAAERFHDSGGVRLERMAERVIGGEEEPARAAFLGESRAGSLGESVRVIRVVNAVGRAAVARQA